MAGNGFGVDPNIGNEFGHTIYPKWVDHPTEKENGFPVRVRVKDKQEEEKLLGAAKPAPKKGDPDWNAPKT